MTSAAPRNGREDLSRGRDSLPRDSWPFLLGQALLLPLLPVLAALMHMRGTTPEVIMVVLGGSTALGVVAVVLLSDKARGVHVALVRKGGEPSQ
jgi:NADPH:quinone reductase-like Zn-dependent oxidoreductase